jgi:Lecithin:cholesterol acyltransferase
MAKICGPYRVIVTSLGGSLQKIRLGPDDPEAENLEDGIVATRLVEDAHLVPGLVKIDGYTKTTRMITDNFDVITGNIYTDPDDKAANFYHFPYDWRRDNRASARILKRLLDKRLKCWRAFSGAEDAKVILLAHSMGGLISRYYLEVLEGWQDSRALFTFGTPYRGSVRAVDFLANGYKKLFLDLTEVMRSLTSVYQLLPVYEMVKVGDEYKRVAEAGILPNIVQERAQDALAFHREIEAAVKIHLKNETYRSSLMTIPIVGIQQPTFQSAVFANGKLTVGEDLPKILHNRLDLCDGDGTVPQVSAIPIELSNSFNNSYIAECHASLQNQSQILADLLNRLETSQFDLAGVRATQAGISLTLDDLYLSDEPIQFRARVISPNPIAGALKAVITSADAGDTALTLNFVQQEKEWTLAVDQLPPGLYRVAVQTEQMNAGDPPAVHDVFEVVSPSS